MIRKTSTDCLPHFHQRIYWQAPGCDDLSQSSVACGAHLGRYVGLGPHDRFAQVTSMSWDVHIIEVYGAISARATSVTCPDMIKKSGPGMQLWLKNQKITGMSVVPSHLRTMSGGGTDVSGLPHLRILNVGGEALGADVVSTWAPSRCLFINSYGPSEISVVCTAACLKPGDAITIGVALLRKKKTKAKFIELPSIGRVYKTGDLASCSLSSFRRYVTLWQLA